MELTLNGLKDKEGWAKADVSTPSYDVKAVSEKARKAPQWVHFGIGNIFRIFLGGIADTLISEGEMDRGIICFETFDFDVVDKIYKPYDNLVLSVTLHTDGRRTKKVLGSLSEAVKLDGGSQGKERLREIFSSDSLQMVSFTITEKGYELRNAANEIFPFVKADYEEGPSGKLISAMSIVTAALFNRYNAGKTPIALVSMDNVSQNGKKLRDSVLEVARAWNERGFVSDEFMEWVSDETKVSFPWSMIDKITPRPSEDVADDLEKAGIKNMQPVTTSKKTFIAPFVNAEGPQYLVIEDSFPNGRPPLEKAGVYMTDRDTVNASERMKVTVCLNPIHSALGPYGVLLGIEKFSDVMKDPDLLELANIVGPREGMAVVVDPGIISPDAFMKELMEDRFVNPYLPDTNQRLCTDISQMLAVRFGVTTKAYMEKDGTAANLKGVPLAVAGWLRYLLAIDDEGKPFELAPDPANEELTAQLSGIKYKDPSSVTDQLVPIISNANYFGVNLYEAGLGEKVEELFKEMIEGKGAARKTLHKHIF